MAQGTRQTGEAQTVDSLTVDDRRWVFGYGSLMWRPGFPYAEKRRAKLYGKRRAFCIYSVHHRGTYERPGLVLGLADGGSVTGAVYRVEEADWADTYAYLREREQPTETYVEARATVTLSDGRRVNALTFLSDRTHPQWAGVLPLTEQAALISGATGLSGRNVDYLRDLVAHLRSEGVRDAFMQRLLKAVEAMSGESLTTAPCSPLRSRPQAGA